MGRYWFSYGSLGKKTPMSNTKNGVDTWVLGIEISQIQAHLPYFQNIERSFLHIVYIMLSKDDFPTDLYF